MQRFDICLPDADLLMRVVSEALLPSICPALDLAQRGGGSAGDGKDGSAGSESAVLAGCGGDFTPTEIALLDASLPTPKGQICHLKCICGDTSLIMKVVFVATQV